MTQSTWSETTALAPKGPSLAALMLARRHTALTAEIRAVRADLLPAVRDAAAHGVPQVEIAKTTDWTREHIRNIVAGKVKA